MLERLVKNNVDITDYKRHPRLLELRFVLTYDKWLKEFGGMTDDLMTGLAEAFRCDINKLRAVASQAVNIKTVIKKSEWRYTQEVILIGELWGESRFAIVKKWLKKSLRSIYGKEDFNVEHFITEEWLNKLDNEVVACGMKAYAVEVERFLDMLENFKRVA